MVPWVDLSSVIVIVKVPWSYTLIIFCDDSRVVQDVHAICWTFVTASYSKYHMLTNMLRRISSDLRNGYPVQW